MEISFNLPINSVSFGQVSLTLLREAFNRKLQPSLVPIGEVDLSSQSGITDEFKSWLSSCLEKGRTEHSRESPCLKLWHLNGGMESVSNKPHLLTFYELDEPTKTEINVAKNNKVIFTSSYTKSIFEREGIDCSSVSLGFDSYNFHKIKSTDRHFPDDRITFNLVGKFERRKHHEKVVKAWLEKFGNNRKYLLQCAIYNPFFSEVDNGKIWDSLGRKSGFFNLSFLGFMKQNSTYNEFLNSGDIVVGMSGGEGWGLPEFQSVCLGKHAVILNASSYKDWANKDCCVMIEPSGKIPAYDGIFFKEGGDYNQGSIFDFSEDDFISGCEEAIKKVEASKDKNNEDGELLRGKFSTSDSFDKILDCIDA